MIDLYSEIAEPSRRLILSALRGGPKSVSELVDATGLKQPNVSNHLSHMRSKGTVRASKVGRQVFYAFGSPQVERLVADAFETAAIRSERSDLGVLAEEYAHVAILGDEFACGRIIDRALSCGWEMVDVYQDLFGPALELVGKWWTSGAIDVGQEHLATAITERAMGRVVQMSCPAKRHQGVAILGCAEGAWHTIGLRMIADYLRIQGWWAVFLGPNVPQDAFVAAIRRHHAELALINCSAEESRLSTLSLARQIKEQSTDTLVGIGGWAVKEMTDTFRRAGGDFSAPDLRTFGSRCLPRIEKNARIPPDCRL